MARNDSRSPSRRRSSRCDDSRVSGGRRRYSPSPRRGSYRHDSRGRGSYGGGSRRSRSTRRRGSGGGYGRRSPSGSEGGLEWQQKMIERYNVDDAAQQKLDLLPPRQVEQIFRTFETGSIRNPSAFIMKAAQNALYGSDDRGRRGGGRGRRSHSR